MKYYFLSKFRVLKTHFKNINVQKNKLYLIVFDSANKNSV